MSLQAARNRKLQSPILHVRREAMLHLKERLTFPGSWKDGTCIPQPNRSDGTQHCRKDLRCKGPSWASPRHRDALTYHSNLQAIYPATQQASGSSRQHVAHIVEPKKIDSLYFLVPGSTTRTRDHYAAGIADQFTCHLVASEIQAHSQIMRGQVHAH